MLQSHGTLLVLIVVMKDHKKVNYFYLTFSACEGQILQYIFHYRPVLLLFIYIAYLLIPVDNADRPQSLIKLTRDEILYGEME